MPFINAKYSEKEILASITQRGQVTIPAEVRRILGTKPKDKIAFLIDGERIHLAPASFTLESAYGSISAGKHGQSFEKLERQAKDEHAKDAVRKLNRK